MIDQYLININFVFLTCCIIIIPNIIQNGIVVPEIFKFENDPITYQVTSAIFGRFWPFSAKFPEKSDSATFYPLYPPNFMQKIRKNK